MSRFDWQDLYLRIPRRNVGNSESSSDRARKNVRTNSPKSQAHSGNRLSTRMVDVQEKSSGALRGRIDGATNDCLSMPGLAI